MNHQTERIIKDAKDAINDECVFSADQISLLERMIDGISEAIEKESDCNKFHTH